MNDPELERLAAVYRAYRRPSSERRARIEAAVRRDARGAGWTSPRIWLAVFGVAAAIVLTWMAVTFGERQGDSTGQPPTSSQAAYVSETAAPDKSTVVPPAVREVAPAVGETAPATRGPSLITPQQPDPGSPEVSPSSQRRPSSSPTPRPRSRERPADAEETAAKGVNAGLDPADARSDIESMRWLREAERDLSRDPSRALARLRQHFSRYPRTPLALERDALFVLALCQTGDHTQGRQRRAAFLQEHTNTVYESRIRAACPEHQEQ